MVWCLGPVTDPCGQDVAEEVDAGEEDDEDYLMNLERRRVEAEQASILGTMWEPSLVICWAIVAFVTVGPFICYLTCCTLAPLHPGTLTHWHPDTLTPWYHDTLTI